MTLTFDELKDKYGVDGIEARDWVHQGMAKWVTIHLPMAGRSGQLVVPGIELPDTDDPVTLIAETRNAVSAARRLNDMKP